ncbi:hypothetical protein CAEBREN_08558 [Caenorhabditis brenneri]|uniref:R3H-associated N-terminal domain-containing protein n=1 Tax=Caenorhabditis brenneri TaxID=135651 RepID=G0MCL6_CAEBE|nr:hypothetical protein CAEBREN_08558 [Caenorhabditis brenneri]
MGVPRRENPDRSIRIENFDDDDHHSNHHSESADEINEISRRVSVEQLHPIRNKAAKKMKMGGGRTHNFDEWDTDGVQVKRNMGMRKWRRVEHARIMLSFTDLEDICEDGSDIATPPTTAFDKLFNDKENMRLWNEFCSRDETEQRRILNGTSKLMKTPDTPTTSTGLGATTSKSPSGKTSTKKVQKRSSPYSTSACFDRIDLKCRMMLCSKKVNWAFVDFLERELRTIFRIDASNQQDKEAIFTGHYPSSSDRLLAHIVAQWLGLSSQSITDPSLKERVTEFRNRRPLIPPQSTLIEFMERRIFMAELDFVPFSMRGDEEDGVEASEVEKATNLEKEEDYKDDKDEKESEKVEDSKETKENVVEDPADSDASDTSFVVVEELEELNISGDNEEDWEKVGKTNEDV